MKVNAECLYFSTSAFYYFCPLPPPPSPLIFLTLKLLNASTFNDCLQKDFECSCTPYFSKNISMTYHYFFIHVSLINNILSVQN